MSTRGLRVTEGHDTNPDYRRGDDLPPGTNNDKASTRRGTKTSRSRKKMDIGGAVSSCATLGRAMKGGKWRQRSYSENIIRWALGVARSIRRRTGRTTRDTELDPLIAARRLYHVGPLGPGEVNLGNSIQSLRQLATSRVLNYRGGLIDVTGWISRSNLSG